MTVLTLAELKSALESAKAETVAAYKAMSEHRIGDNSEDAVEGERLQHRYLLADAIEMEWLRKIGAAEDALDEQQSSRGVEAGI